MSILPNLDVAYIPTPKSVIHDMLNLASLRRGELLYDLGAGDGRILIEAARKFGARCVGVEIDPERVTRLKERLTATRVEAKVIEGDFMQVDVSDADVVAIYLSESVNSKLAPKLMHELKPGSRVVSLDYELPAWHIEKELIVKNAGMERKLFLHVI